ncbi:MAG: sigma-70 family RNA polymerase sigma factor [Phycisphaerales bacterium]|nr:MAG: sigma-70 family RNA polymerase sigma factor [Phycisphaerales bacterium]UCF16971.1 MAG: sigma-70 family RNA polymerase sigma factor [Phycisphaerales bacterium]
MSNKEFGSLVNDCGAQVLNTAVRILGDLDRAQDVHQEVFLAIWKRWHKYDGLTNWNAYLYRVTVRKAIEFARQSRSEQLLPQQAGYIAGQQTADGPLRTAELQTKLAKHLARLPKRQADVFVLSRIEGLDARQIADILGCSSRTVRVHLHRAVKRLARELGAYLAE